jgi:excinuclease ABC subunit A
LKHGSSSSYPGSSIRIRGARTHNLKDVSVSIPTESLTVITGVSGSGKSSLAFDTLYAEGQRRYAESLSTYARQFLERLDRPEVDSIEPVPPAIALEQKNGVRNARSTVGTQTEITDSMRLLFAHGGTTFCSACGAAAVPGGVDRALEELAGSESGARLTLVAPVPWRPGGGAVRRRRAREERLRLEELKRAGFFRACSPQGETVEIGEEADPLLEPDGTLPVVVGRFVVREQSRAEIASALDAAFAMAGSARAVFESRVRTFRRGLHCPSCAAEFREPTPALFAFNSPLGACSGCQGFGRVIGVDLEKVIPNPSITLSDRPVAPWNTPAYESAYRDLFRACRRYSVRTDIPVEKLSAHEREVLLRGRGEFYGVEGFFDWLETKRYKIHVRVLLARYRAYTLCPECRGARLTPAALSVRFRGQTIAALSELPLGELQRWLDALVLDASEEARLSSVLSEIRSRVRYMNDVGLDYLTLSRAARTLSGGEAQRIGLASALGGSLTGTLYVLDEPTIGLHAADTRRLLAILRRLADRGNTVVVVEHDPEDLDVSGGGIQ